MPKKQYLITATWSVYGAAFVEAESLEEAKELAECELGLNEFDVNYLENSFEIDHEACHEL